MSNPNSSISTHGLDALHRLKSIDPVLLLSPSPEISATARSASQHLFSSLLPFCSKFPFDRLLVDGFDAEQIWQQIDIQSQPFISNLRKKLRRLEQNPGEISKVFDGLKKKRLEGKLRRFEQNPGEISKVFDELKKKRLEGSNDDEAEDLGLEKNRRKEVFLKEDGEDGEFSEESEGFEEEGEEEEEEEGDEEEEKEFSGSGEIEDRFLKIKELEEYLERNEERNEKEENEKVEDKEDGDYEEDEMAGDGDGDEEEEIHNIGSVRYDDFFSGKKKKTLKKRVDSSDESEGSSLDEEQEGDENLSEQNNGILSTHEKQLEKIRSDIEQMEKANLEPKSWTMQGEVTAPKRPKNSALEVDLDFEHNVRPAPVITEEVTASLEELIKKRILEGHFDDVQKAPSLQSKPPKELKELDENKSKKGLAEIYEEEYVQKTSVASAPLTFNDEQKKEATVLFKRLCLKLDALSHFHFAPKPVIEDMSIQPNVPALAMEEIAPLAVSDAAMLAPEEVFTGKGDIKEETELSQAERKRRRANKKRKFKAKTVKRDAAKKARDNTVLNKSNAAKDS